MKSGVQITCNYAKTLHPLLKLNNAFSKKVMHVCMQCLTRHPLLFNKRSVRNFSWWWRCFCGVWKCNWVKQFAAYCSIIYQGSGAAVDRSRTLSSTKDFQKESFLLLKEKRDRCPAVSCCPYLIMVCLSDGSGMFGISVRLHLRCLHETGIFKALYHISPLGVFLIAFCSIKTDRSKRSRWFVCRCVSHWASPPKIRGYFSLPPFAPQLHLCSVYLRCLSVPFTSSVYSALPDTLILPVALERTAEPWESVDTFLSESAALNFQRNVWADIWNWTSSGQQFIWAFWTNSHAYFTTVTASGVCLHFSSWCESSPGHWNATSASHQKKVLFVQSSLLAYEDSRATVSDLSARSHGWWLITPPLSVRTAKPSARLPR